MHFQCVHGEHFRLVHRLELIQVHERRIQMHRSLRSDGCRYPRGTRDQIVQGSAAALGGNDQASVLHIGPGIAQVGQVLAGRSLTGLATTRDRIRPGGVVALRMPLLHLGEVRTDPVEAER